MLVKPRDSCEGCFKPVARRLALFKESDEYECYAEGYVKCFWGLCSLNNSEDNIVSNTNNRVVIEQPRNPKLQYQEQNTIKKID